MGDETSCSHPSSPILHPSYDSPLPWDHLDTGIDKQWLKDDLQRALDAATVPDCSFDGCSHCGVCGLDFGHNVVVPPQPIPQFAGQFVPNQNRVQRLRVWLGKQGEMVLLSHLDLMRLFDRAVRRAGLPIAYTGGYHPGPRIIPANALSLGVSSSGEIVDFELTAAMPVDEFQAKFSAQLPAGIPVYRVEVVDGSAPAATQLLEKAEYVITVGIAATETPEPSPTLQDWQQWIEQVLASHELCTEHTTKSGKTQIINLRDHLFTLQLEPHHPTTPPLSIALRYIGSCRNDGNLLRPEQVVFMLEQVAQRELQLLRVHRDRLILANQ